MPSKEGRHLFVLVHGLHGNPSDLEYMASQIKIRIGDRGTVLVPSCNVNKTCDGIMAGAQRICTVILEELARDPSLEEFTFIGHSLGGLYARACLPLLDAAGALAQLALVTFATLATPHLGSRMYERALVGPVASFFAGKLFGRTGRELMLTDDGTGRQSGDPDADSVLPLLVRMCDERHLSCLRRFRHLVLFSNTGADLSVSYCTAAIRQHNPFVRAKHPRPGKVCQILADDTVEPPMDERARSRGGHWGLYHHTIHSALCTLPWKRLAVIPSSLYLAHVDIVVHREGKNDAGKPVVQHIVEHIYAAFQVDEEVAEEMCPAVSSYKKLEPANQRRPEIWMTLIMVKLEPAVI
eukprot:jgi/Mesvir1/21351/Mv20841-RA.1